MARQSRPTLILTRPAEASARFADQVQARFGDRVECLIAPLMEPQFLTPDLPAHWDGVIFTSETGVAALARLTDRRGPASCVGARTTTVAQAAGWQAEALGPDAATLLIQVAARRPAGLWLHARGLEAAGTLAEDLRAAGVNAAEVVVYAQRPCPLSDAARLRLSGTTAVLTAVFSPRSARLFVEQAKSASAPLHVAAISAAAAAPMAGVAARIDVATTPDAPGMLDALARLLSADSDA